MIRRARHAALLAADIVRFGRLTGAIWLVPVAVVLALVIAVAGVSHAVVPYVVYTFF